MEFPVRFENPFLGVLGIVIAGAFAVLFYSSYKRIRIAERKLELVKWQKVRKFINATNIFTKIGTIIALLFLLATPYIPTTVKIPVENISSEQLAKTSTTILVLMDVSQSMNISDLTPTRMAVAKQVARIFLNNAGPSDQIGFISFAGKIYDDALPTTNRTTIQDLIDKQTVHSSTAIGTALDTAIGTIQNAHGGRAIVLLSDGKNNYGVANLTETAQLAASLKIPIFSVFLGTYGIGTSNPEPLQEISNITGGKFHEIRSEEITTLATEISQLAKDTKVEALKAVMNEVPVEAKDYHTATVIFAALLACCLFLTWFTGV